MQSHGGVDTRGGDGGDARGGPFTSSAFSWTSGASTPGTYTVTVADAAGNTATTALAFTAEPTAPTGAVTAPAAAANVRGTR